MICISGAFSVVFDQGSETFAHFLDTCNTVLSLNQNVLLVLFQLKVAGASALSRTLLCFFT